MRAVRGLGLFAVITAAVPTVAPAQEPTRAELLRAVEKQLKATGETAGPAIATIVVSRSEFYSKVKSDIPGKLGGFDRNDFLKTDPSPERVLLAKSLDLADAKAIPDRGYAGGVVIDGEGYVLTPYHVIDGATKVYVFLPGGVGSYADIHAADSRSDLAVLKLITPPPKLKAIKFAEVRTVAVAGERANVFPGKLCVLMVNPYSSAFGIDQPSSSFGSITNVRYRVSPQGMVSARRATEYGVFLEYDMKSLGEERRALPQRERGGMNANVTGGALLNLDGEMIGLTNATALAYGNEVGPGYAVPTDEHFRRVVAVLRRGEEVEYGFLGVVLDTNGRAVVVGQVSPNGPADVAKIREGETITGVNGHPIEGFPDLLLHVGGALAGTKVTVTVAPPFGREREVAVTLAKFQHGDPFIASVRPEPVFGLRVDHSSVLAQKNRTRIDPGVCVREVIPDSPAAKQFKTLGDAPDRWLVTHVNGAAVTNPGEFYKAAKGQEKVKLSLTDPTNNTRRELTLP